MGATNHTTNYNLSQFEPTDKPAWLQDYNGDMTKIDAGINTAQLAADAAQLTANTADGKADTANGAITNTITPAISALQTASTNQGGAINTINALIGNGTPTTTDQTIIGAINEINAEAGQISTDIAKKGIGAYVDIATANSATDAYVAPSDGYVELCIENNTSAYGAIHVIDTTDATKEVIQSVIGHSTTWTYGSVYVKKGMKVYYVNNLALQHCWFRPIVS